MRSSELAIKILNSLKNGVYVSGEEIGRKLSVSRTSIWKEINFLRKEGYTIRSFPHRGYLLYEKEGLFNREEILSKLKTKLIGSKLFFYDEVSSTNDSAYQYALKNKGEGMAFVAESQTRGRGRRGREWFSPEGKGLWFSLILRPNITFLEVTLLPLLIALACAESIEGTTGLDVKIKWPNDLLAGGKKFGGILLEMKAEPDKIDFIVAGIGIDVNFILADYPVDLKAKVTSLEIETGKTILRAELLVNIFKKIEEKYLFFPKDKYDIIKKYSQRCSNLGKFVKIDTPQGIRKGKALKIDGNGCLILEDKKGKILHISSGDIL